MARTLRIEIPGAIYHITNRGNRKSTIFEQDSDRRLFLKILAQTIERFGWFCYAYCLMDNHYHLLLETPEPNLSRGMRHLNGVYTQKFNFFHDFVGHVFQGRYKSMLIEKDAHLMEVCRYIVLNPVRAGLVNSPRNFAWSSYNATAGLLERPEFLHVDWLLNQFGNTRQNATHKYREFIKAGLTEESSFKGSKRGLFYGSKEFIAQCRNLMKGDVPIEVPKTKRNFDRQSLAELFKNVSMLNKSSRNELIGKAYLELGYSMSEIGKHIGKHYTTISIIIKQIES